MSNFVENFDKYAVKSFEQNHRYMPKSDFAKFTASLHDYGDLSPIVINLNTNTLIGGHRRDEAMDLKSCTFVWTIEYDEPDHQGTLALGYVKYNDALYNVRLVWWDTKTEAIANIAANKLKGHYDLEELINHVDEDILKQGGFSEDELTSFADIEEPTEGSEEIQPTDKRDDIGVLGDDEGISIIIVVQDNFELNDVKQVLDTHLSDFKYKIV